jgi:hypothetical protein
MEKNQKGDAVEVFFERDRMCSYKFFLTDFASYTYPDLENNLKRHR